MYQNNNHNAENQMNKIAIHEFTFNQRKKKWEDSQLFFVVKW